MQCRFALLVTGYRADFLELHVCQGIATFPSKPASLTSRLILSAVADKGKRRIEKEAYADTAAVFSLTRLAAIGKATDQLAWR